MATVKLISSDNEDFTVDKEVAEKSVLIKNMLEGELWKSRLFDARPIRLLLLTPFQDVGDSDAPIPLPNVTAKILRKVKKSSVERVYG